METTYYFCLASLILWTSLSRSDIFSLAQPCLILLSKADYTTSAVTLIQPQISAALG
jgi:hypothetical protein